MHQPLTEIVNPADSIMHIANLYSKVAMFRAIRRRVCRWGLSLQSRQLLPGEVAVGGSRRDAHADGVREGKPVATLHCRPVLRCCGSRAAARWRCGAPGLQRTRAQRAIEWRQFERFYFQTSNYCVSLIANTSKLVGLLNISRKIGGCRNFYISHEVNLLFLSSNYPLWASFLIYECWVKL